MAESTVPRKTGGDKTGEKIRVTFSVRFLNHFGSIGTNFWSIIALCLFMFLNHFGSIGTGFGLGRR